MSEVYLSRADAKRIDRLGDLLENISAKLETIINKEEHHKTKTLKGKNRINEVDGPESIVMRKQ
jgi:hypothetical protein